MFTMVFGMFVLVLLAMLIYGTYCAGRVIYRKWHAITVAQSPTGEDEPMSDERPADTESGRLSNLVDSLTLRAALIGCLAIVMLVPLAFVGEIVHERANRYYDVLSDIARTWGAEQTFSGPVLAVPFTEARTVQQTVTDADGVSRVIDKTVRTEQIARFLPDDLTIDVQITDEVRVRGIYKSLVYSAVLQIQASIDAAELNTLSSHIETIHWDKAWLSIGLSDTRSIKDVSMFEWDDQSRVLSPGTRLPELPSGFHAALPLLQASDSYDIEVQMTVAGSGSFNFMPFGEDSRITIASSWPHPSFHGDSLPDSRNISAQGFSASWDIPHLARNYPQAWFEGSHDVDVTEFVAGVSMFEPVSLYSQVTRAVKYGILFIGLTFLTLLIVEIAISKRMHVIQYALIGVSLCLFFLVLLSLSEHIAFFKAYIAAAALTIGMISIYTAVVLSSVVRGVGVSVLLISLYAVLYSLLQLEDYALLVGTCLLVVVVMVLMFVTRDVRKAKINDYQANYETVA